MAFASVDAAPPRRPPTTARPSSDRASPRHPPSSPRHFIQETQTPRRQRSSTLTPVGDGSSDDRQQVPPARSISHASPMSHPLFAGWADASLFESLVSKDVSRLHRKLSELRCVQQDTSKGRRELVDPMGCARSLADMLLEPIKTSLPKARHAGGPPRRGSSASDVCASLQLMCGQLAGRAAQLEVLLALLAEFMVRHLLGSTVGASSGFAGMMVDSTGCPWTRIGWIDEVVTALDVGTGLAAQAPETTRNNSARTAGSHDVAIQAGVARGLSGTCRHVEIQTVWAMKMVATQTDVNVDSVSVLGGSPPQCCAEPLKIINQNRSSQTELQSRDATTVTDEAYLRDGHVSRTAVVDESSQTAISHITVAHVEVQASVSTCETSLQASVCVAAMDTQTASTVVVDAEVQTHVPSAPKPRGLREKKLNADDANRQLASAREKLALEREATAALEEKMSSASLTIASLNQEATRLRDAAAASAAKAAAAALRPVVFEVGTQSVQELTPASVQTDNITFYSHSWQEKPSSPGPQVASVAISTQTEKPVLKYAGTQTRKEKRSTQNACVGDEEPLDLTLGAASLPSDGSSGGRWRNSYGHGMQALAEQWRTRYEAVEVERKRLAQIVNAGNVSGND